MATNILAALRAPDHPLRLIARLAAGAFILAAFVVAGLATLAL